MFRSVKRYQLEVLWLILIVVVMLLTPRPAFPDDGDRELGTINPEEPWWCDGEPTNCYVEG